VTDILDDIREGVRLGKLSPEEGARSMELLYEIRRIARRARLKRWLRRVLTLGLWR